MIETKVLNLVKRYLSEAHCIDSDTINCYIVWQCYILGNRKYLVGAGGTDLYFEVTYDEQNDRWYLDEYEHTFNRVYANTDVLA